jgi:hypothetical protein
LPFRRKASKKQKSFLVHTLPPSFKTSPEVPTITAQATKNNPSCQTFFAFLAGFNYLNA